MCLCTVKTSPQRAICQAANSTLFRERMMCVCLCDGGWEGQQHRLSSETVPEDPPLPEDVPQETLPSPPAPHPPSQSTLRVLEFLAGTRKLNEPSSDGFEKSQALSALSLLCKALVARVPARPLLSFPPSPSLPGGQWPKGACGCSPRIHSLWMGWEGGLPESCP